MIISGNWKMNLGCGSSISLAQGLLTALPKVQGINYVVFPQMPVLEKVSSILSGSFISAGSQNVCQFKGGAYTGETSAEMIISCGGTHTLIGHSERRHIFGESDSVIASKVKTALEAGLIPFLCVGETLEERQSDKTWDVLTTQIKTAFSGLSLESAERVVIAYEPVWAIGTGVNATSSQAESAHVFIRDLIFGLYNEEFSQN